MRTNPRNAAQHRVNKCFGMLSPVEFSRRPRCGLQAGSAGWRLAAQDDGEVGRKDALVIGEDGGLVLRIRFGEEPGHAGLTPARRLHLPMAMS